MSFRSWNPRAATLAAAVAGVLCLAGIVTIGGGGATGDTGNGVHAVRGAIPVEIAITADRASWRPDRGGSTGTLTFGDVAPRMALMTEAPRRQVAIVPAHFLTSSWQALFEDNRGVTNAVLSVSTKSGGRRLVNLAVRFVRTGRGARRLEWRVEHLERGVAAVLGRKPATYSEVTMLIDPRITDKIKNLWAQLLEALFGRTPSIPKDPVSIDPSTGKFTFDKGKTFKGPDTTTYSTPADWAKVQKQIFDAAGSWQNRDLTTDVGSPGFTGASYAGLALIPSPKGGGFDSVDFNRGDGSRMELTGSSINLLNIPRLSFTNVDVGGVSMRGTQTKSFNADNSGFSKVDWSGARFRGGTIQRSAFEGIRTGVDNAKGDPKDPVNALGSQLEMSNVKITSSAFEDTNFARGSFDGVTFEGCKLSGVDFTGSKISGPDRVAGQKYTFAPTFDGSLIQDVKFEGAELRNVSFSGVDFTNGGVSFEGATLSNVDFTGAKGLENIDFSGVTFEGDVYGLAGVRKAFDAGAFGDKDIYLRSVTEDGLAPEKDPDDGQWDIDSHGHVVIPETGVRLERATDGNGNEVLYPFDPNTGRRMVDPRTGHELRWEAATEGKSGIYDPARPGIDIPVDPVSGFPDFGDE